ncbi:hypothetical protein EMCRGX_G025921 [Ephydatia muelleri]
MEPSISDGNDIIPGAHLAVSDINNRSDVLTDYRLELLTAADGCNVDWIAVVNLIDYLYYKEGKQIVGIVGPECSDSTKVVASITGRPEIALLNDRAVQTNSGRPLNTLKQLWEECLETRLDPDVKGRIIGVQAQMDTFNLLFGLHLSMKILKITDNLSRTLQTRSMSASEGQSVAELSVKTLQLMRNDESFDAFFRLVNCFREQTGTSSPKLPRKRKVPSRFEVGEGKESYNDSNIEDHYRRLYFEVLDLAVTGISQRFNQPGYSIYKNLENLLVYAANRKPFDEQLCAVLSHYGDDLASCQLSAQLQIWGVYFAEHCEPVSLRDCIQALQKMSATQKELLSEVIFGRRTCELVKFLMV